MAARSPSARAPREGVPGRSWRRAAAGRTFVRCREHIRKHDALWAVVRYYGQEGKPPDLPGGAQVPADPMHPADPADPAGPGQQPGDLPAAHARDGERKSPDAGGPDPEGSPAGQDLHPGVDDWDPGDGTGDWDPAGHSPAGRDRHPGVDDWDPDAGAPPAGAVFAQGRWGDGLAPDPVLATLLDLAGREGLEQLDDDQLTGVLQAAARLASWSASLKLAATSRLAARREEDGKQTGDWRPFDHVDDEVAVALTLTRRSAGRLVELALGPGPAAADPRGALRGADRRAPR